MSADRTPFSFPGCEGKRLERVVIEPEIPPSPKTEECQIDLRPGYLIPDFLIDRFTVTKFDRDENSLEGTIEGLNTSVNMPLTIWWKGKKDGQGEEETRSIIPQFPLVFVDDEPRLTLFDEFDNIALALALVCWFSLEDGTEHNLQAPSLEALREAILGMAEDKARAL